MTLVERAAINPWYYRPLFDFQNGEWLHPSFEMGNFEPWPGREMPDLALIITQILLKNHTLLGQRPEHLLAPVPYSDFIKPCFMILRDFQLGLSMIFEMYY
ncbi:TPA: hypothetical protein ACU9KK_000538 [Legionella anisa]|uniref:hypothetical protein n=1 Tax=Legionella anisa TaxID=28082 RepID=UPI001CC021A7|nr:hypothetical protein [Legionella anisa]